MAKNNKSNKNDLSNASSASNARGVNQSASGVIDVGQFDGSADPNPGGRLGWGWHLCIGGEELTPGSGEQPPRSEHTNNMGEYMGLISLLEDYIARGGQGPLEVGRDSQLVIRQVTGQYKCYAAHLVSPWQRSMN